MSNRGVIGEICNVFGNEELYSVYRLDDEYFDGNLSAMRDLFTTMFGPSRGKIAFNIYKHKLGIKEGSVITSP